MYEKHTDQLFIALLTSLYYKFFLVSFPTNFLLPKETSIMQSPLRFSSCRGVAFEIKPHADPFAIERPAAQEPPQSGSSKGLQFWPWLGSSKVFPSSLQPSLSRPSSHFCDPDPDEDDEEESSERAEYDDNDHQVIEDDLEKQANQSPIHLLAVSKRESQPKVTRKKASRLSIILLCSAARPNI